MSIWSIESMEALLGSRTLKVIGILALLGIPLFMKLSMDYYEARVIKSLKVEFAPILKKQEEFNELTRSYFIRNEALSIKVGEMEKRMDKLEIRVDASNGRYRVEDSTKDQR